MAKLYVYPSDVTDEDWVFVLPYLLLPRENSASREQRDRRPTGDGPPAGDGAGGRAADSRLGA